MTATAEAGPGTALQHAFSALAAGRPVILSSAAEPGGVLCLGAANATTRSVAFAVRHSSGLVTVALPSDHCDRLGLVPMVPAGTLAQSAHRVSVDLATGTGTGISAADRARTIRRLADPDARPDDFTRPGHVLPIAVAPTGAPTRPGVAEIAVDLAQAAGLRPAAAICALVSNRDPRLLADGPEAADFADHHGLVHVSVDDAAAFLARSELRVTRVGQSRSRDARITAVRYAETGADRQHSALVKGEPGPGVIVVIHQGCQLGELLGADMCECGGRFRRAREVFMTHERAVLVHVQDECGQDECGATAAFPVGAVSAQILADLGISASHGTAVTAGGIVERVISTVVAGTEQ